MLKDIVIGALCAVFAGTIYAALYLSHKNQPEGWSSDEEDEEREED